MPCAARFVTIWTKPSTAWAKACCGATDRTSVNVLSAFAKFVARSLVIKEAPVDTSTRAVPTNASILPGSSAKARSKKPRACVMFSGVSPLLNQAMP